MMMVGGKLVDESTLEVAGIDFRDYPDFCDAHFSEAKFKDGTPLDDDQLAILSEYYPEVIHERANRRFYQY